MESESWPSIFSELEAAESKLAAAIDQIEEAVKSGSSVKTGHKSDSWRNIHAQISKASKNVEKLYSGYDFDVSKEANERSLKDPIWKDAIGEYLIREGWVLDTSFSPNVLQHRLAYAQLSAFLQSFDQKTDEIFNWIKSNFPEGEDKEDLLVDFVHYLFEQKLRSGDLVAALKVIKNNSIVIQNPKNQKIINKLLTKCLFANNSAEPQIGLLAEPSIETIKNRFVKVYCKISNIPKSDPLTVCNELGSKALPALDRLSALVKNKNHSNMTDADELPIELPIEDEYIYHSIFSCPVLKQQSSEINPPYLLTCGHALSKDALTRLSKGSSVSRFKCPYCPNETNFSSCIQLTF